MPGDSETATQSVDPTPQPGAGLPDQVNPAALGATVGAAVEQGSMIGIRVDFDRQRRQQQLQQQASEVEGQNAINTLRSTGLAGLHGQGGLFTTNPGVNAGPAAQSWQQQRQKQIDTLRQTISNPDALKSFDRAASDNAYETQAQIDQWQEHQIKSADVAATQGALQTAYNGVVAHASDPAMLNHHIALGAAALMDSGRRNQVPDYQTKDKVADWTSSAVTGAISTLVDSGQTVQAQALAQAHKDEILGDDVGRVSKLLQHGDVEDRSLALSGEILKGLPPLDPTNPDHDIMAQRDAAQAKLDGYGITDGRLYDAAQRRLDTHFRLAVESNNEAQSKLMLQAYDQIHDPANPNRSVSPSILSKLDWKSRISVNQEVKRVGQETDAATFDKWQSVISSASDANDLKQMSVMLLQDKPKLSDAVFQGLDRQLTEQATKLQNRDTTLAKGLMPHEVATQIFNENGLAEPKGDDAKPDSPVFKSWAAQRGMFTEELQKWGANEQLVKKAPLTLEEWQNGARTLMTQTTWQKPKQGWLNPGKLWGSQTDVSGPAYQAPWAKDIAYRAAQIPAADLQRFIRNEKEAGLPEPKTDEDRRARDALRLQRYNNMVRDRYQTTLPPAGGSGMRPILGTTGQKPTIGDILSRGVDSARKSLSGE